MKLFSYAYKTVLLISLASITLYSSSGHCVGSNHEQRIKTFVDKEYSEVLNSLKESKEAKDSMWAKGDVDYYQKWQKGIEHERSKNYLSAINLYQEASKINRYEMSSYNVSLPLGRALFLNDQKQEALKILRYFTKQAEDEIAGNGNDEWPISEEGKAKLKEDVEFAKWLITLCKKK